MITFVESYLLEFFFLVVVYFMESIMSVSCNLIHMFSLSCVSSEIRAQLVEQQKCLDQQTEMRVQLLQDLQDFFRKKAEIETEYSRNLEKLAERFMAKTRSTKDHQQYK